MNCVIIFLCLTEDFDTDEHSFLSSRVGQSQGVSPRVLSGALRDDQEGHGVNLVHMASADYIVHTQALPSNLRGRPSSDHSEKPDRTAGPDSQTFPQTGIQVDLWSLCCQRKIDVKIIRTL